MLHLGIQGVRRVWETLGDGEAQREMSPGYAFRLVLQHHLDTVPSPEPAGRSEDREGLVVTHAGHFPLDVLKELFLAT